MARTTRQNSTAGKRIYKRLFSKGGAVECRRCGVYYYRNQVKDIVKTRNGWLCVSVCLDPQDK